MTIVRRERDIATTAAVRAAIAVRSERQPEPAVDTR
jgi:hypothetical protein